MSLSRRGLAVMVVVAVLVGVVVWQTLGHETPAGQPPLVTIGADGLAAAVEAFNARPEDARLILLLSPT